jgi:hypothetical protein
VASVGNYWHMLKVKYAAVDIAQYLNFYENE